MQTFSLRTDSKLRSSPLSGPQGPFQLHPPLPVPRPSSSVSLAPRKCKRSQHMLTYQPSSPHYELWTGSCTGKIRRPKLPQSSGLECPFCSVAEAKEGVAGSLSLISTFPLLVPQAQGTSCSAPWVCQYNSVGDWPLIKLHQLDPVDKKYTYCLTHPSQALA